MIQILFQCPRATFRYRSWHESETIITIDDPAFKTSPIWGEIQSARTEQRRTPIQHSAYRKQTKKDQGEGKQRMLSHVGHVIRVYMEMHGVLRVGLPTVHLGFYFLQLHSNPLKVMFELSWDFWILGEPKLGILNSLYKLSSQ